jgi:hypothetical protein
VESIIETNCAAHRHADYYRRQFIERPRRGERADRLIAPADFGATTGQIHIGAAQSMARVGRRQANRLQPIRVERNKDLPFYATDAFDLRNTPDPPAGSA